MQNRNRLCFFLIRNMHCVSVYQFVRSSLLLGDHYCIGIFSFDIPMFYVRIFFSKTMLSTVAASVIPDTANIVGGFPKRFCVVIKRNYIRYLAILPTNVWRHSVSGKFIDEKILGNIYQKQPPEVFCKKGVLKNFLRRKFLRKQLCGSLFLIKLQAYAV